MHLFSRCFPGTPLAPAATRPCTFCPQDLNPLPFPAIAANCAGWIAYSYVTSDVLVLWPNAAGFL